MTGKITLKGLREDTIEKTENHSTTTADESEGEVSEVEDMHEVRSIEMWLSLINQSINPPLFQNRISKATTLVGSFNK